jgi:hypothetical protein
MTPTITISLVLSLLLTLSDYAAESVDSCFGAIASGTADQRSKAISQLAQWLQSSEPGQAASVMGYTWDPNTHGPDREHCKVLLEAVPKIIDTLQTDQRMDAWVILVRVTSFCPATTNRDIWLKWWKTDGRTFYVRAATPK